MNLGCYRARESSVLIKKPQRVATLFRVHKIDEKIIAYELIMLFN